MDENGEEIRRWVNPRIKRGKYSKLIVDPVVFHTPPQATDQVTADTLAEIHHYTNEALQREFAKTYPLMNKVSPEAARVRIAITGVTAEVETATFYDEVTSFVTLAGGWLGAGKRDRKAFLLIEAELTDSVTGEKLGMGLRKVPAKKLLTADRQQLTLDVVRPFLDERAANARVVLERVMK